MEDLKEFLTLMARKFEAVSTEKELTKAKKDYRREQRQKAGPLIKAWDPNNPLFREREELGESPKRG